jgi:CRP-like cAMP-binding protein
VALERAGVSRRYRAGATLLAEGSAGSETLLIRRGHVKVVGVGAGGNETLLAVRGPGDLVGEFAALAGTPRSATLVALGGVEAIVLPVERFQRFLREHPAAAGAILADVIGRLRESDRQRVESAGYDAPTRLAVLLLNLAEEHGVAVPGGGHSIGLPLSQQDLADAIGASRESVARALATFRAAGLVHTRRRDIIVIDAAALRAQFGVPPDGDPGKGV